MSRIGEVYRINYKDGERYFQLVASDMTTLNSDVIAVFKHKAAFKDAISKSDVLARSDVEFFTHTTVHAGVKQDLWERIGTTQPVDFTDALFKNVDYKQELPDIEPYEADSYHSWVVWHVNGEWQQVGGDIHLFPDAELGMVYPPDDVVYRIKHGRYSGVPYYGQMR